MSEPIIELRNANIYQRHTLVLKDVNITINKGEFVYLIGRTGSGKSSLLKILYGDLPLREGTGIIAGFSAENLKLKQVPKLRRKLGIVFQDFQLLTDRSVTDNLVFVLKATGWEDKQKIKERVEEVLNQVGLGTKGFKMPYELSGGEQQRIVIARALLNNPELILADEPTGNLDPETSDDIIKLLKQLSQELHTAVLMATHDYSLLDKFPSRIIKCENNKVLDTAKPILA